MNIFGMRRKIERRGSERKHMDTGNLRGALLKGEKVHDGEAKRQNFETRPFPSSRESKRYFGILKKLN